MNKVFAPIMLTTLVVIVFSSTIRHGFVWDDEIFVTFCKAYQQLDIRTVLFSLQANGIEYLPVRDLTYLLDFALWGNNPVGFHLSNLVWYWLTVIMIFYFTKRFLGLVQTDFKQEKFTPERNTALFAAALFCVHPIHCEAVNFVTCRNVLVSAFFFFFSCRAYLGYLEGEQNRQNLYYIATFIGFLLSIFSKATGLVLPLIFFLIACSIKEPRNRRKFLHLLPFFIISGVVFIFFKWVAEKSRVIEGDFACSDFACVGTKIATAAQIPIFYIYKIIIPVGYSVDYDSDRFSSVLADPRPLGALFLLLVMATVTWRVYHKAPLFFFSIMWFMITLLPVLHLFPTNPIVADRYAFLPSFAPLLLISVASAQLADRRRLWSQVLPVVIIIVLAILSTLQNKVWKGHKQLWEHTALVSPRSSMALSNLALYYFNEEKAYVKALEVAYKAQEIDNSNTLYDMFQGELLLQKNDPPNAVAAYSRALFKRPEDVVVLLNLGRAYEALGDSVKAKEHYLRAICSGDVYMPNGMREMAQMFLNRLEGRQHPYNERCQ